MTIYYTPRGLLDGEAARLALEAASAWPLLGAARAFTAVEVTQVEGARISRRLVTDRKALDLPVYGAARAAYCGIGTNAPIVMGVINVTPDSFSDGGQFASTDAAVAQGIALAEAGASLIDVGGESTRPGADPVGPGEEIARAIPVVRALAERNLRVSIDTRNGVVAEAALAAGAMVVNDIAALRDARSMAAVARSKASVLLMHMRGEPRTMQIDPIYRWAPGEVYDFLSARIAACLAAGIGLERIAVDPGIGFGKTFEHNTEILGHMTLFHGLGCPVAIGASRKGFIGRASRGEGIDDRLAGSLAAAVRCAASGVQIFRVHDVGETRQALAISALGA